MEKVRKAEVPPPSSFNRRVTPELDAITLKALARDVADRYQSAQQLSADLDALIASYRFDPKELRQFMRQLFRKEYAKELEDTELALDAEPGASMSLSVSQSQPRAPLTGPQIIATPPTDPLARPTMQGIGRAGNPPTNPNHSQPPETPPDDDGDKPRGFWGSLFRKRK